MSVPRRLVIGALALATAAALAACEPNDNGNNTLVGRKDSPTPPGAPQTTGVAQSPGATVSTSPVTVEAKDNEFGPKSITVKAGEVTFHVKDTGVAPHTFTIKDLHVDQALNPGKSADVKITLKPGTYKFVCLYHESIGMVGDLTVT